jgi:putative modified peptide
MDSSGYEQNARITISDADAQKLLERLATDDDFRAELEANAAEVLRAHGIELDPEAILESVTLAPKAEIEEFLEPLRTRQRAQYDWLGFAVIYYVLGAMPFVLPEDDGTG